MNIEEHLSFKFKGERLEAPYQYEAKLDKLHYEMNPSDLGAELTEHFRWWMYSLEVKKSQRFSFLDYHMSKYNGDPMDFWEFVKNSPAEVIGPDRDTYTVLVAREIANYVEPKIEWLELRKEYAYGNQHIFDDNRIEGRKGIDYIHDYFISSFLPEGREPIMSLEDVMHFLRANFKGFKPKVEPKLLETNCKQIELTRIIRRFFNTHSKKNTEAQVYCKMMKDNFQTYMETMPKSLVGNFAACLK